MSSWEHMRIAVSYRENGNVDFVARRESGLSSIATHQEMRGHFNVEPTVWDAYLETLKAEGWEVESLEKRNAGREESYSLKRPKRQER